MIITESAWLNAEEAALGHCWNLHREMNYGRGYAAD
jgi:hypothetical protein